jgi:ABC-2 type transport system ATP-binding protein
MESIVVEGATKRFTLRHAHSIKEMTVRAARRQSLSTSFTALDDVSLTVHQGESLALMGLNGSGKSTLLKLISGVMQPDAGSVRVRGRVAGLIEVGAGLHPDLTGRENIFLNAAILGMSRAETEAKYDAIVAFSEIEKFLETQVKFYSSGMFMRLGFSVAVHTEPDIFLVDEVLAVGDPPFQKKCVERIQEFHEDGRTLVIVSHDMGTLERICGRGVVLREGRSAYEGDIHDAVDFLTPPESPLEAAQRQRGRSEAKAAAEASQAERAAAEETARLVREVMPAVPRFPDPLATLEYGLSLASDQDGMALEFGVFSGRTLRMITAAREGKNVFGFDSFDGLPEHWRAGFPAGTFAVEELPEVLGAELVVGLFEDTLADFLVDHPEPVAFLHIDADLYSSAKTVLRHVGPRLRPGSVIVFDEYFNYPGWQDHEYLAWQEHVAETGVRFRYEAHTRDNEQVVVRITGV